MLVGKLKVSPRGAVTLRCWGQNLRTLLVLSPCGACHLTVPESSVAPARSHLVDSTNLIIHQSYLQGFRASIIMLVGKVSPRGAVTLRCWRQT